MDAIDLVKANVAMSAPPSKPAGATGAGYDAQIEQALAALARDGAVVLPPLVGAQTLAAMQAAFKARLEHLRWNNVEGYSRTEWLRLMVEDVLTVDQGFVDIGVHPIVTGIARAYVGPSVELCEAKGWRSLPMLKDAHGWHSDAWYDQAKITDRIPRELKLAFYLSDVTSGAFQYLKGTHGREAPRHLKRADVDALPLERMMEFKAPAGTAIMFDTSGIHRQGVPSYDIREAVFLNYHDPKEALQKEDVDYYRYHPLLLNAAFLGGLTGEQTSVLGFGSKSQYQHAYIRKPKASGMHAVLTKMNDVHIHAMDLIGRINGKVASLMTKAGKKA